MCIWGIWILKFGPVEKLLFRLDFVDGIMIRFTHRRLRAFALAQCLSRSKAIEVKPGFYKYENCFKINFYAELIDTNEFSRSWYISRLL